MESVSSSKVNKKKSWTNVWNKVGLSIQNGLSLILKMNTKDSTLQIDGL